MVRSRASVSKCVTAMPPIGLCNHAFLMPYNHGKATGLTKYIYNKTKHTYPTWFKALVKHGLRPSLARSQRDRPIGGYALTHLRSQMDNKPKEQKFRTKEEHEYWLEMQRNEPIFQRPDDTKDLIEDLETLKRGE